jgi:uncharacterized protein with GYD domain
MPHYVALCNWTELGIKNFKDSPKRLEAARRAFEARGAKLHQFWYTMGPHDCVALVEAPSDEVFNRALLEIAAQGNLRSTSLKAYTPEEFATMVQG